MRSTLVITTTYTRSDRDVSESIAQLHGLWIRSHDQPARRYLSDTFPCKAMSTHSQPCLCLHHSPFIRGLHEPLHIQGPAFTFPTSHLSAKESSLAFVSRPLRTLGVLVPIFTTCRDSCVRVLLASVEPLPCRSEPPLDGGGIPSVLLRSRSLRCGAGSYSFPPILVAMGGACLKRLRASTTWSLVSSTRMTIQTPTDPL